MQRVAFTGSFDPWHQGHQSVVDACIDMGLDVVVVIANNDSKDTSTTMQHRSDRIIFKQNLSMLSEERVTVVHREDNNVEEIYKIEGVEALVRGVRNAGDLAGEFELSDHFRATLDMPTIWVPAKKHLRHISSSGIRNGEVQEKA